MSTRATARAVLLSLCMFSIHASAQSPDALRADSAFQRQDWATSASLYGNIARSDTTNGMAWFRLGASLEAQRNYPAAAEAYGHGASRRFQPLNAELRLSRTYAQMNDNQQSLAHLRNASAVGFPGALIANEPALATVRQLPEYAAIVKVAEDAFYPCHKQHEFDYWEGTFFVTPWDSPPTAKSGGTATNTRQYQGCVFVERWDGGPLSQGMSMVIYDASRHAWRMLWNDDQNGSNDFEGHYTDGAMRFSGWVLNAAGKQVLTSNVLQDVSPDVVHHIFSTSADSGKTWSVRSSTRWTRQH